MFASQCAPYLERRFEQLLEANVFRQGELMELTDSSIPGLVQLKLTVTWAAE